MVEDPYPCEHVVAVDQEPRHHLVVANEFVRGFAVEIAPHDRTLCHRHADEYLVYVVGDAHIVGAPRDREPTTHTYRDGDCELSPSGLVHVVENQRATSFRNLVVELLPGVQVLRRGPDPEKEPAGSTPISGDVKITQRFDDPQIAVFLLELNSGSQTEIFGPAIVASPYGQELEVSTPNEGARTLTQFLDLFWLDPFKTAMLRNRSKSAAKAVLFAVGRHGPANR